MAFIFKVFFVSTLIVIAVALSILLVANQSTCLTERPQPAMKPMELAKLEIGPDAVLHDLRTLLTIWPAQKNGRSTTTCDPHNHILFLKTPKTGSTTMSTIFLRYAFRKQLRVALPTPGEFAFGRTNQGQHVLRTGFDREKKFDIMSHHGYFNKRVAQNILPNDTIYMVMLREPLSQFKSQYNFMHIGKKYGLRGQDQLKKFLSSPTISESGSVFSNVLTKYFGFKIQSNDNTPESAMKMINQIDNDLDYVLLMEYFDEGLVMIKRRLCWDIADIIYLKIHDDKSAEYTKYIKNNNDPLVSELHRKLSYADYMLYDYFKKKFENLLKDQDPEFSAEVNFFKLVIKKVEGFCDKQSRDAPTSLDIPACKWTRGFTLQRAYCDMMRLTGGQLSVLLKSEYYKSVFLHSILRLPSPAIH